jgi:hypothetical protein
MAFGLSAPGCFGFGGKEIHYWEICASSVDGKAYCVPEGSGPGAAWADVKAHNGAEPIEMWVVRADDEDFDEWVARPGSLDAYLDTVQEVLDHVRVTQKNAESYQATMAGRLGRDLFLARMAQEKLIAERAVDPKERIQSALMAKAAPETDPLKAEVAADKQSMGDVQAIVDQAMVDAA